MRIKIDRGGGKHFGHENGLDLKLSWSFIVTSLVSLLLSHKFVPMVFDDWIEAAKRFYWEFNEEAWNEVGKYLLMCKRDCSFWVPVVDMVI